MTVTVFELSGGALSPLINPMRSVFDHKRFPNSTDFPAKGMPFAADDVMFNPPIASRTSQQGAPVLTAEPQILANDIVPTSPPPPVC